MVFFIAHLPQYLGVRTSFGSDSELLGNGLIVLVGPQAPSSEVKHLTSPGVYTETRVSERDGRNISAEPGCTDH